LLVNLGGLMLDLTGTSERTVHLTYVKKSTWKPTMSTCQKLYNKKRWTILWEKNRKSPPSKGTVTSMVADVRVEMLHSSPRGAPTENSLNSLTGRFSKTAIWDCVNKK
jgi:hypothetical protein